MSSYLDAARFNLDYYKSLGERAMAQLDDAQLRWRPDDQANSIAIIVKHLAGNMKSRWTDLLTRDGEKPWRDRDGEFIDDLPDRAAVEATWQAGWRTVFESLDQLGPEHLDKTVTVRGKPHTVTEAIERQVAHYAYHVGQIVWIARQLVGPQFQTLSIARGRSADYRPTDQR